MRFRYRRLVILVTARKRSETVTFTQYLLVRIIQRSYEYESKPAVLLLIQCGSLRHYKKLQVCDSTLAFKIVNEVTNHGRVVRARRGGLDKANPFGQPGDSPLPETAMTASI